ncbi:MAG: hypothetical protein QOK39_56, partial [Acidimicrobiaceae bacterium]|nr:hypothetical protein [Acidimicrobiaceae bacterium]
MPSLVQLDEAVREFLTENPDDMVTVVVDASFGHRIDASELKMFEEAEEAGELVSPPAGAIGRGDAFLLRIADKTGATVLSNDSFQEFHGDYDWLFERGRLIGGKPVPAVGWIFTPRTPVRGPRSREAVKEAKRSKGDGESTTPGLDLAAERSKSTKGRGRKTVERAIAVALEEAVAPKEKAHRPRKGATAPAEPVNDPLTFITFIAAHPLGGEVSATVESFASHGAFVECEGARCYVPLSAMGEPPPKSAREMFSKGELVTFVVQALDPQRRGVELAMPGFAKIAGAPTEETVAAEIEARASEAEESAAAGSPTAPVKRTRKKAAPAVVDVVPEPVPVPVPAPVPAKQGSRGRGRKAASVIEEASPPPAEPVEALAPAKVPSRRRPTKAAPAAVDEPAAAAPRKRGAVGKTAKETVAKAESAELASPARKSSARKRAAAPVPAPGPIATPGAAAPAQVPEPVASPAPRGRKRAVAPSAPAAQPAPDAPVGPPASASAAAVPGAPGHEAQAPPAGRPTKTRKRSTPISVAAPTEQTAPPALAPTEQTAPPTASRRRSTKAAPSAAPPAEAEAPT